MKTRPIIQDQPIVSKAKGFESIAKVLGSTSEVLSNRAESMAKEASDMNAVITQSDMHSAMTDARVNMINNPSQSQKILQDATQALSNISSNAYVNSRDRSALNAHAQGYIDELKLNAVHNEKAYHDEYLKFQFMQSQADAQQQFYGMLKNFRAGSEEQTRAFLDQQMNAIDFMVKNGTITADKAMLLKKPYENLLEFAAARNKSIDYNVNTHELHATNQEPNPAPYSQIGNPIDQTTQYYTGDQVSQWEIEDARAALARGANLAPDALFNVKSTQKVLQIIDMQKGVAIANAAISSGQSWQQLHKRRDELKEKGHLFGLEDGEYSRLNYIINDIEKNGAYLKYINMTPTGQELQAQYNLKSDVINKTALPGSPIEQEAKRRALRNEELNKLIDGRNALGIGMDIPDQYRNVIPPEMVSAIKDGFKDPAKTGSALATLGNFNKRNIAYAAQQMGSPDQALAVYNIGMIQGRAEPGFMADIMASTKFAPDADMLEKFKDAKLDIIDSQVGAQMGKIMSYLGTFPNAGQLMPTMVKQASNYVKYMAAKNNDFKLDNKATYIKNYFDNINRAYDIATSNNYIIDKNVIPKSDKELQTIANAAIKYTRKFLLNDGYNEAQIDEMFSRSNPRVVSTPTGRLVVVDNQNRAISSSKDFPVYDFMYTDDIVSWAKDEEAKEAEEAYKKAKEAEKRSPFKLRTHY